MGGRLTRRKGALEHSVDIHGSLRGLSSGEGKGLCCCVGEVGGGDAGCGRCFCRATESSKFKRSRRTRDRYRNGVRVVNPGAVNVFECDAVFFGKVLGSAQSMRRTGGAVGLSFFFKNQARLMNEGSPQMDYKAGAVCSRKKGCSVCGAQIILLCIHSYWLLL